LAYLFDTNAISEALKPRPNPELTAWLRGLPREEQFTSAVVVGELYVAAYRLPARDRWLRRIDGVILPAMTVLGFDVDCAEEYGRLRAALERAGTPIGDVDTQIAATALRHNLTVVTANVRHFQRVPDLRLRRFAPGSQQGPPE
jgi:predicted nucleic acid-binding protein